MISFKTCGGMVKIIDNPHAVLELKDYNFHKVIKL